MNAISSQKFSRSKMIRRAASVVIAVAALVLIGWTLNISYLKSILPAFPEMKPNSAIAFAIAAAGLFAIAKSERNKDWGRAAVVCGIVIFLIGSLTLFEYIAGFDLGLDTALFQASHTAQGNQFPGRMSPHSAFNFTIMGISLVLLTGGQHLRKASEFLAILFSITTVASVIGYLYGAKELYGVSSVASMALHTAGLFLVVSFGLLAANYGSKTANLLTSDSLGGVAVRRLLPAVIFVPTSIDWLRIVGQEHGLFDPGFGSALMQISRMMIMSWIMLVFSAAAHKIDLRRRSVESELADNEQKYRNLFDHSQGMICIHGLDGILTTVNPAVLASLGYESDEVIGRDIREFLPDEYETQFAAFLRQIENEGLASGLLPLVSKTGKQVVWRYNSILVSEPGKEPYILGHAQDVTALMAAQTELKNLSLTDDLTGLYNRRGFLTLAEQQIRLERHGRTARGLSLMFADIDGLKMINDTYGHEAGSDAIIELARILKIALRTSDIIARWGGDEFVMLTIGSEDKDVELMTDRINRIISEHNAASDRPYMLACSIGVAVVPLDGNRTFEDILAEADEAMYAEKRRRKAAGVDHNQPHLAVPPHTNRPPALDLQNPLSRG